MIIGLGSDLCDITRVEKTLERFGERFVTRVFTDLERRKAEGRAKPAATYAKRFAAKDMGVVNLPSGAPTLALSGGAKARLDAITPQGHRAVIHLTLTDDHPMAMAVVMIEALRDV